MSCGDAFSVHRKHVVAAAQASDPATNASSKGQLHAGSDVRWASRAMARVDMCFRLAKYLAGL